MRTPAVRAGVAATAVRAGVAGAAVHAGVAVAAVRAGVAVAAARPAVAAAAVRAAVAATAVRAAVAAAAVRAGVAVAVVRAGVAAAAVRAGVAATAVRVAVAVAVVAAVVAVALVMQAGAGDAGRGGRDARAFGQAVAVDRLLAAGVGSRVRLASAVDLVTRCVRLDAAVAELAATADERVAQRGALELLDLSRLERRPGELRDGLRGVLVRSADTDAALLGWARARQADGCGGDGFVGVSDEAFARARRVDSTYRVAMRAADTSTEAKRAFLDRWNPVATRLGLRVWTEHDI